MPQFQFETQAGIRRLPAENCSARITPLVVIPSEAEEPVFMASDPAAAYRQQVPPLRVRSIRKTCGSENPGGRSGRDDNQLWGGINHGMKSMTG